MLILPATSERHLHSICAMLLDLIPRGRGARRAAAGGMLIIGLGRLGFYTARSVSHLLTDMQYGLLLVILSLLIFVNGRWRMMFGGRICAALGAIILATMAWDVGYIGVTSLLESWFAVILLREVFTSHDC